MRQSPWHACPAGPAPNRSAPARPPPPPDCRAAAAPPTAAKRRALLSRPKARAGLAYDPAFVYTFSIYDHAFDYATFKLPFFGIDMVKVLDGQVRREGAGAGP
jgi:hypothetical protein